MDNNLQLERLKEYELIILNEFDRICKKYDLKYCLVFGTLLGAIRHKGFIPWDDDIDVGMPRNDYKKFLKVAKKELAPKFFLQTPFSDKGHPVFWSKIRMNNTMFRRKGDRNTKKHHGIFIDIFPMDYTTDKKTVFMKIKRKIAYILSAYIYSRRERIRVSNRYKILYLFPQNVLIRFRDMLLEGKGELFYIETDTCRVEDFFPTIDVIFEGGVYPAPHNYDGVLYDLYGNYMELPPLEERVGHFPEYISFDVLSNGPNQ